MVDETGWVKQGSHSVGVARQYCGAVGQSTNCQVSVEVVVSDGCIAAPVAGRLYLPAAWTEDRNTAKQQGVPADVSATKPALGLAMLRQAQHDGVPPAPVLGDRVYGDDAAFRAGVRALGLEFFLQVEGAALQGWDHKCARRSKRTRRRVPAGEPPPTPLAELTRRLPATAWKPCS